MGGSSSACGEPTQTQGEHTNSTKKDPRGHLDSNPRSSCCEAPILLYFFVPGIACLRGTISKDEKIHIFLFRQFLFSFFIANLLFL